MLLLNLDHVAVAVTDLDAALERHLRMFGGSVVARERVEEQGVEEAMIAVGGSHVQLVAPLSADTPVGRFLERRGEGLHHLAYAVADIDTALADLAAEGAEMIDTAARLGGGGRRIAFVHPKSFAGTLIELVEIT